MSRLKKTIIVMMMMTITVSATSVEVEQVAELNEQGAESTDAISTSDEDSYYQTIIITLLIIVFLAIFFMILSYTDSRSFQPYRERINRDTNKETSKISSDVGGLHRRDDGNTKSAENAGDTSSHSFTSSSSSNVQPNDSAIENNEENRDQEFEDQSQYDFIPKQSQYNSSKNQIDIAEAQRLRNNGYNDDTNEIFNMKSDEEVNLDSILNDNECDDDTRLSFICRSNETLSDVHRRFEGRKNSVKGRNTIQKLQKIPINEEEILTAEDLDEETNKYRNGQNNLLQDESFSRNGRLKDDLEELDILMQKNITESSDQFENDLTNNIPGRKEVGEATTDVRPEWGDKKEHYNTDSDSLEEQYNNSTDSEVIKIMNRPNKVLNEFSEEDSHHNKSPSNNRNVINFNESFKRESISIQKSNLSEHGAESSKRATPGTLNEDEEWFGSDEGLLNAQTPLQSPERGQDLSDDEQVLQGSLRDRHADPNQVEQIVCLRKNLRNKLEKSFQSSDISPDLSPVENGMNPEYKLENTSSYNENIPHEKEEVISSRAGENMWSLRSQPSVENKQQVTRMKGTKLMYDSGTGDQEQWGDDDDDRIKKYITDEILPQSVERASTHFHSDDMEEYSGHHRDVPSRESQNLEMMYGDMEKKENEFKMTHLSDEEIHTKDIGYTHENNERHGIKTGENLQENISEMNSVPGKNKHITIRRQRATNQALSEEGDTPALERKVSSNRKAFVLETNQDVPTSRHEFENTHKIPGEISTKEHENLWGQFSTSEEQSSDKRADNFANQDILTFNNKPANRDQNENRFQDQNDDIGINREEDLSESQQQQLDFEEFQSRRRFNILREKFEHDDGEMEERKEPKRRVKSFLKSADSEDKEFDGLLHYNAKYLFRHGINFLKAAQCSHEDEDEEAQVQYSTTHINHNTKENCIDCIADKCSTCLHKRHNQSHDPFEEVVNISLSAIGSTSNQYGDEFSYRHSPLVDDYERTHMIGQEFNDDERYSPIGLNASPDRRSVSPYYSDRDFNTSSGMNDNVTWVPLTSSPYKDKWANMNNYVEQTPDTSRYSGGSNDSEVISEHIGNVGDTKAWLEQLSAQNDSCQSINRSQDAESEIIPNTVSSLRRKWQEKLDNEAE